MNSGIKAAYAAHGDGGERSIGPIIGVYSTLELAEEASKGKGFFGSNGHISQCSVIHVLNGEEVDTYLLAADYPIDMDGDIAARKEARREELLAAMSDFDKIALGLA